MINLYICGMENGRGGSVLTEGGKHIYETWESFGKVTSSGVVVTYCFCFPHYSTDTSNISLWLKLKDFHNTQIGRFRTTLGHLKNQVVVIMVGQEGCRKGHEHKIQIYPLYNSV